MGQRRMAFLREWADEHECTLYEALEQTIDDEIFKRTKAKQLLALVERFRGQFEGRAVSDVMAAVLNESGYDRCCAPREAKSGSIMWLSSNRASMSSKLHAARK